MKTRLPLLLTALLLTGTDVSTQSTGPRGDPPGGPSGGNYTGPGDTVPEPGSPRSLDNPRRTPPGIRGPQPEVNEPESPYAPGSLNPLTPDAGPGGPNGSSGAPAAITPASRPVTEYPESWQIWWHYNRWAHLDGPDLGSSGADGFYLGRGEEQQISSLIRASRSQIRDLVQPSLIRALRNGGTSDFVIFTLHSLAKLRGIPSHPELGSFADVVPHFIASGNQAISEKAVLALGIRGEDRCLPMLLQILRDTPEGRTLVGRDRIGHRLRAFAAYGLGLLGERTNNPDVRAAIYEALESSLWIERSEVQAACLKALGLTPMPLADDYVSETEVFQGKTRVEQVLSMTSFFEDPEQSFIARTQAPMALARLLVDAPADLRGRAIYAFLVASSPHSKEQREVQSAAVIALGMLGRAGEDPIDQEVRRHLETIAKGKSHDRSTRYFAMISLAQAASRRGSGDEPFAGLEKTRKVLLRKLARSRGETQAWAAIALGLLEERAADRGQIASPDSSFAVRQIFTRTRSHEVAGALAISLGMMRDQEAQELLHERMLKAGEANVRAYCALALGMIRMPGVVPDIRRVLEASKHQPFVVENAAIALSLLGDQEAGSILYSVLERSSSPKVQASIASAMGWIKDPRPLGQLCERLLDTRRSDTSRAWTAVAVGRICDADDWPWVGRLSANVQYESWLPTLIEPGFQTGLLDLP